MEIIGREKIWTYGSGGTEAEPQTCTAIRKSRGHTVKTYLELARKIAELQFLNRDYVLLFRGQAHDFKNRVGSTTLKPEIMRGSASNKVPLQSTLENRFAALERAEQSLVRAYNKERLAGIQRFRRQQILRWSILQHYKVCATPLLDVTQSLRIAASFASLDADSEAFVFVLGIPHISGAITASAEAGLQIVRLASVCPPSAVRPHIQEGYLLGEYPELSSVRQKDHYKHYEIDFGRRLLAKFRIDLSTFWKSEFFPQVLRRALYPGSNDDPLRQICEFLRAGLPSAT